MAKKQNKFYIVISAIVIALATALFVGCNKKPDATRPETPPPAFESVTIDNKTELQSKWYVGGTDRKLILTLAPDYYSSANTDVEVSSNASGVVSVDETDKLKLHATGVGNATVTVTANGKTDSVELTVSALEAPTIGFVDQTLEQIGVIAGVTASLPEVEALSCDGVDLGDLVTVTASNDKITVNFEDKTFTVPEQGNYELTFVVKDRRDESKTATVKLAVKAYRNLIKTSLTNKGANDEFFVNEYAEDLNQTLSVKTNSNGLVAQFNTAKTKQYFAEMTFRQKGEVNGPFLVGVAHSDEVAKKWFVQKILVNKTYALNDLRVAYHDTNGSYDFSGNQLYSLSGIVANRKITASSKEGVICKISAVRMDNIFYIYVNDALVDISVNALSTEDSVPGIFFKGANENIYADGIYYCSGEEAKTRFDALSKTLVCGAPQYTGLQLAPCQSFNGDFEFEFNYKALSYAMNDSNDDFKYQSHRLQTYVKDTTNKNLFDLGAYFTGYGANKDNAYLYSRTNKTGAFARNTESKLPDNDFTFYIKRMGKMYTVSVKENVVGGMAYTETFTLDYKGAVKVEIYNYGVAGEYTDVKWDVPQPEDYYLNSDDISVMSKGDEETIVWEVAQGADISVTSSNENAVRVENRDNNIILNAIGVGETSVSVVAGGKTIKTLNIKVFEPVLKNEITNKGKTDSFVNDIIGGKQVITTKESGNGLMAQFVGIDASKKYYAETIFKLKDGANLSGAILLGLTHSNADATRWIVQKVLVGTNKIFTDLRVAYHNLTGNYDLTRDEKYSFNIPSRCTVSANTDGALLKVAIYRDGEQFYFFVNDVLVDIYTYTELVGVDTIPGIFFKGVGGSSVYATETNLLTGDKAESKYAELGGMTIDAKNSTNKWFNIPLEFNGDFTLSFTYKLTGTGSYGNNRLIAEVKANKQIGDKVVDEAPMGIYFNGKTPDATYGHKMFVGTGDKAQAFTVKEGSTTFEPEHEFVFTISRSGNMVTYTIAEKGGTLSVTNTATIDDSVAGPLKVNVKSCGTVGVFNGFTWTMSPSE